MMERTCAEFAADLAARKSVPGGGAAAAYVGALGVALCSMAGNFTLGKKAYANVEGQVADVLSECDRVQANLLRLVQEDACAFEPLSRAYGIPKEGPGRAGVLETATKDALQAPLQMMRELCKAVDLMETMERICSKLLVSDVGCCACLCSAALQAASLNVFVNTKVLADRPFAARVEAECDAMLAECVPRADAVAARALSFVRGGN